LATPPSPLTASGSGSAPEGLLPRRESLWLGEERVGVRVGGRCWFDELTMIGLAVRPEPVEGWTRDDRRRTRDER